MPRKICDLNGAGSSSLRFGVYGTDLCIPYLSYDGMLNYMGGDSFSRPYLKGDWWSPIVLRANPRQPGLVTGVFTDPHGKPKQLLNYQHHNQFGESTRLPTDVILLGQRLYMHFMVMGRDLSETRWMGTAYSDDGGANWIESQLRWRGDENFGMTQMNTWCDGGDGWVYAIKARGLTRDSNAHLWRVRPEFIGNPAAYQAWGFVPGKGWAWGNPPSDILPPGVTVGELCLRRIEGKFVLSYFRTDRGFSGIEIRVVDTITSNWHTAIVSRPIRNTAWGMENNSAVAQLYGGYIMPVNEDGSPPRLNKLTLVVSQWRNPGGDPYRSMLFADVNALAGLPASPAEIIRQRIADALSRLRRR
jgi:hypothetical protein